MICPNCGIVVEKNVRFCPKCGANLQQVKTPPVTKEPSVNIVEKPSSNGVSFDTEFYDIYMGLQVVVSTLLGCGVGFYIGKLLKAAYYSKAESEEAAGAWVWIGIVIGGLIGFLIGKIKNIIPKLLIIIAKNTKATADYTARMAKKDKDYSKERVLLLKEKMLSLKEKGLISQEEFESYNRMEE